MGCLLVKKWRKNIVYFRMFTSICNIFHFYIVFVDICKKNSIILVWIGGIRVSVSTRNTVFRLRILFVHSLTPVYYNILVEFNTLKLWTKSLKIEHSLSKKGTIMEHILCIVWNLICNYCIKLLATLVIIS